MSYVLVLDFRLPVVLEKILKKNNSRPTSERNRVNSLAIFQVLTMIIKNYCK
jgi:hypothetical protein